MPLWSTLLVGLCLLAFVVAVTVRGHGHPGPKRTRLFETEDGTEVNPFGDFAAGAEPPEDGCETCGSALPDASYGFCPGCGSAAVADD